jgi:aerobic carbon-monoxide dehydrogenase medium subunit
VKAPSFAYAKPGSLPEVLELLERHGAAAKILAGGQSLVPSLNLRLSSPELLVDITGLAELKKISLTDGTLRIGALVTHTELERSDEVTKHLPLLSEAVPHIAHIAIRNRGTIGGSLALADPAAEYPACALALDALLVIESAKGRRSVAAAQFFKGLFETDLNLGEIITAIDFPLARQGDKSAFLELTRRHGDYAIVGLAASSRGADKKLAFFGVGSTPVLAKNAASQTSVEAAKRALSKDLQPAADLYNSSATKLHLASVLLERAWNKI